MAFAARHHPSPVRGPANSMYGTKYAKRGLHKKGLANLSPQSLDTTLRVARTLLAAGLGQSRTEIRSTFDRDGKYRTRANYHGMPGQPCPAAFDRPECLWKHSDWRVLARNMLKAANRLESGRPKAQGITALVLRLHAPGSYSTITACTRLLTVARLATATTTPLSDFRTQWQISIWPHHLQTLRYPRTSPITPRVSMFLLTALKGVRHRCQTLTPKDPRLCCTPTAI